MCVCYTMKFLIVLVCFLFAVVTASPYNKYGRTCKDILCTVREECVMEQDACTAYTQKCGAYPTCKRKPGSTTGCAAMRCPTGHFCSIRQVNCDRPPCEIKPTCIAFRTPAPNKAQTSVLNRSNSYNYNSQYNRDSWRDRVSG